MNINNNGVKQRIGLIYMMEIQPEIVVMGNLLSKAFHIYTTCKRSAKNPSSDAIGHLRL